MNHDDHKPDLSTLIDPELEARIVAWVSGEASPFESAELTRLTSEKPELAIFKRRIAAVDGLVGEAIRPDKKPLRLSPDRRTKLLQTLGAAEFKPNSANATNTVVLPLAAAKKKQRLNRRWIYGLAACLTIGLFTVISARKHHTLMDADHMSGESDDSFVGKSLEVINQAYEKTFYKSEKLKYAAMKEAKTEAYKSAFSDAEERKLERESKGEFLSAREADKQHAVLPATGQIAGRDYKAREGANARQAVLSAPQATTGVAVALPVSPMADLDAGPARYNQYNYGASPVNAPSPSLAFGGQSIAGGKKIAANEDQIVLSPFMVEAKRDAGYAAKGTIAGTRVDTDLRDVGSSVSVLSKQFLKDTGATNEKNLLAYTTHTEVAGERISQADKEIDAVSADLPLVQEKAKAPKPETILSEINATKEPVSTFSLHVSDVSFRLVQAALAKGEELDRASIRPEEFYNAFSYGDPTPALAEKVSCRIEQAAHPFVQQRNLVRIAVKVAAAGRDAAQPLHLTVLLDTSGSMEREDRAATIQSAMKALTSLLGSNDRLTLIGFSRQPRLLAEALAGDQAGQVLNLIKNTPAEGGTNLEEALKLGSELAHRQFSATAQNRIVLLTDGAANLGNANPAQLAASIEALRQQGIAFDACGVGLEGLDDGMLENLTRKGDGRYYVLNSPEAADAGFAKQLAGAFRPAAENVKLQVRFNPARVGNYRLIGFEQHRLREEDFRNDSVDAAELAAEEAAVAVYQVEALPQGEGELGEVYVRFRDASSGNMVERNWTLNYDAQAPAFDRATPSMQLAGTAALLAEKLQDSEAAAAINLSELAPVVNKLRSHYTNEPRVQELVTMFEQARKISGE